MAEAMALVITGISTTVFCKDVSSVGVGEEDQHLPPEEEALVVAAKQRRRSIAEVLGTGVSQARRRSRSFSEGRSSSRRTSTGSAGEGSGGGGGGPRKMGFHPLLNTTPGKLQQN
jgi:hypothetical protein